MNEINLVLIFDDDTKQTAEVRVDGTVNGEARQFLLDTGCASTTLISDPFSDRLETIGVTTSLGVFDRANYDLVKIDSLQIGSIIEKNLTVSRGRKGGASRNLLGMDFLGNHRLFFRFGDRKIETGFKESSSLRLQPLFADKGGIPYVGVECGGYQTNAVWDTGAGVTLVDTSFIDKHPTMFQKLGTSEGTDSTGKMSETPTFILNKLVVGGVSFAPHMVVGLDLSHINSQIDHPFSFLLGYSTLHQADWLFDFPKKEWAVLPRAPMS